VLNAIDLHLRKTILHRIAVVKSGVNKRCVDGASRIKVKNRAYVTDHRCGGNTIKTEKVGSHPDSNRTKSSLWATDAFSKTTPCLKRSSHLSTLCNFVKS